MKLLLVTATEHELAPFVAHMRHITLRRVQLTTLVSGVGMLATTYSLTRQLHRERYDFVLQAGVGGSFDRDITLGSMVWVATDQPGDIGAEDHEAYIDVFEMGLQDKNVFPFTDGLLPTLSSPMHSLIDLPQVAGITINTVSGSERTIKMRTEKYHCQVESMEGAALHYACIYEGIPFAQVRAISNYVTPRDKSQWRMKDAIINLNAWLETFIRQIDREG